MRKFKYHPSLGRSYAQQGEIYFTCLAYAEQPAGVKKKICGLCETCGKVYKRALFEYLTTEKSSTEIIMKYYISDSTLWRAVRQFYEQW